MFDIRLFIMSFIYIVYFICILFIMSDKDPLFHNIFTSLFFMFFNYYLAGIWNFMQLDDVYDKPWANSFLFYFKKWFLRFVGFIICIFLVILFLSKRGHFYKDSIQDISGSVVISAGAIIV